MGTQSKGNLRVLALLAFPSTLLATVLATPGEAGHALQWAVALFQVALAAGLTELFVRKGSHAKSKRGAHLWQCGGLYALAAFGAFMQGEGLTADVGRALGLGAGAMIIGNLVTLLTHHRKESPSGSS